MRSSLWWLVQLSIGSLLITFLRFLHRIRELVRPAHRSVLPSSSSLSASMISASPLSPLPSLLVSAPVLLVLRLYKLFHRTIWCATCSSLGDWIQTIKQDLLVAAVETFSICRMADLVSCSAANTASILFFSVADACKCSFCKLLPRFPGIWGWLWTFFAGSLGHGGAIGQSKHSTTWKKKSLTYHLL